MAASKNTPKKKQPVKKPVRAKKPQPTKIDWAEAQKDYLMDATLSYKDIAEKYGVSSTSVEKHAKAQGWVALRNKLGEKATNMMMEALARKKAQANNRHQKYYERLQKIAGKTLDEYEEGNITPEPKELESTARTLRMAIEGERVVLGLPNVISAVTDKDGEDVFRGLSDVILAASNYDETGRTAN